MLAKLANPGFLADIRPLLSVDEVAKLSDETTKSSFAAVFNRLIGKISGNAWAKTPEVAARSGIELSI